jgi:hypothetical protein
MKTVGELRRRLPRTKIVLAGSVCFAGLFAAAPLSAAAFELVTPEESALPVGSVPVLELRGSPTRRPNVVVVSPPPAAGLLHSPLDLKLQFHAFGGAEIDPSSVVVTYLKQPAIDMTQRLAPFITAQGIDIANADVPPGTHQFWIELKDKNGHVGAAEFGFQIAK